MIKDSIYLLLTICLFLTSCSKNDEPKNSSFIANAGVLESGQTLSPGDQAHLEGNGYLETDNVILNFYWETGSTIIPEGYIKGCKAKVVSRSSDGITIQMPYRKPASRVEICVSRGSEYETIGSVYITDGLTPKEFKLYGIYNSSKIKTSREKEISRWLDENNNVSDKQSWALDAHPDFHSAVGASRAYGICGLSEENGSQYPFFLDLCTQEWIKLSNLSTLALFSNGTKICAIQSRDGLYESADISSNLERSNDYLISRSDLPSTPPMRFPLPNGLEAGQFGEYPGVFTVKGVLLSANKGNGKWIPVHFSPESGFTQSDEIEAERLIPFAVGLYNGSDNTGKPQWTAGYIVVKNKSENGVLSEFYEIDADNLSFSQEPIATYPNKALSATTNPDRPGTLTVHFDASRSGNITSEYSLVKREWTPFVEFGASFDEIVWIN